jgi:hypothetical protein
MIVSFDYKCCSVSSPGFYVMQGPASCLFAAAMDSDQFRWPIRFKRDFKILQWKR